MAPEQQHRSIQSTAGVAAFLALGAVVYATLLPFEFQTVSLADTQAIFLARVSESLGIPAGSDRQQWVANLVMFLPLGFFWALWLALGVRRTLARCAVAAVVSILALLVTATVEFLQVWIPGREPSFVDMSGNLAGGIIGAVAGVLWAPGRWEALVALLAGRAPVDLRRALTIYALFYVAATLFPFDFPLSLSEFAGRFTADNWSWWYAEGRCSDATRCTVATFLKPVFALPVGLWVGMSLSASRGSGRLGAILMAVACAVTIEFLQLLLASGVAEGRSLGARGLGMAVGAALPGVVPVQAVRQGLDRWGRVIAAGAVLPYIAAAVGILVGWSDYHWEVSRALGQLQSLQFFPFYYHYHVAEAVAVRSLISQAIAYAPVGVLAWLAAMGRPYPGQGRSGAWWAIGGAVALALVVEGLKLFADGERPDPTTLLIAPAVAAAVYGGLRVVFAPTVGAQPDTARGDALGGDGDDAEGAINAGSSQGLPPGQRPAWGLRACGVALAAGLLIAAAVWPVWAPWLVAGLAAYGVLLYYWPAAAVFVVPAAVPLLDFSLLTGLEVVDEFDLLVVASIAGLLLFARKPLTGPGTSPVMAWLFGLFAVSMLTSSVIGWLEMSGLAAQGVTVYLSEYNILRQVKGFAFAVAFFLVLPQTGYDTPSLLKRYFVPGMVLGLFLVLAIVAWERAAYPGPFNFESTYRPTALFTDMQVGGPTIETYLVMALPFALLWFWLRRNAARCVVAVILLAGGVHAVWITYSRGGYLGLVAMACVIVGLGAVAIYRNASRWRLTLLGGIAAGVLAVLSGSTLWLGALDGFAGQRLGQIEQDLEARLAHWQSALELQGSGLVTTAFGRGPGAFPHASFLGSPPDRLPANFVFRSEEGGRLVLGVGQSVYLNQRVPRPTGEVYELTVRGRSDADASLLVFLCQKHVRHSFECVSRRLRMPESDAGMEKISVELPTRDLVQPDTFPPRHIAISMRNASRAGTIALDSFRLRNAEGKQLLRNADFAAGSLHWYFTTDHLSPWRVENQLLEVYFDQGWFGVITFGLLVGVALLLLARRATRDDFGYAMILASLCGVLVVGMFSTVFFSPRLALLFYLVMLLGICAPGCRFQATR